MAAPLLKLVMLKGPREGETLEFRPGSTIRVGRVVRGNNVTVKDEGVSSKHLLVTSDSGEWLVQDLGSSNGTTLNSAQLLPFKPSDLRDNDTLKLGACTSILVRVEEIKEVKASVQRQLRPRKGKEGPEVVAVAVESKRGRGRQRKAKAVEEEENVGPPEKAEELGKENVGPPLKVDGNLGESNVRVTRNRKNLGSGLGVLEAGGMEIGVGKRTRAGARKKRNLQELPPEPLEKKVDEDKAEYLQISDDFVVVKEERVELGSIFREVAREEKGKWVELGSSSSKEAEAEKLTCDGYVKAGDGDAGGVDGSGNLGEESNVGFEWEKATLGEWFDYMEVYLRKQVMEASEALIEEMRLKAERVWECQMEWRKDKSVIMKKG